MDYEETPLNLFDLPMEDILVTHVGKYLSERDLFTLRCCSHACKKLVDLIFARETGMFYEDSDYLKNRENPKKLIPGSKEAELLNKKINCKILHFRVQAQTFRLLRQLSLEYLSWLTDDLLSELLWNNPLLEDVEIVSCDQVTEKGIFPLAVNCKYLKMLDLYEMPVNDCFIKALAEQENQLSLINLNFNPISVSEQYLNAFFEKQPFLTMIFIADIKTNVRSVLFSIAKSCKNLTFLNITDCFDVDDEAVLSIVNGCSKIDCIIFNKYDEPNWKQSFRLISQNTWDLLERKNIDIK